MIRNSAAPFTVKQLRHEIARLNRIAKKHSIFVDHVGEHVYSDSEGEVLRIRIFPNSVLEGRWHIRFEALKGLLAEIKMHDEILEIGLIKSFQLGDSCSWVVFSLPEGDYDFKVRPTQK